MVRPHLPRLPHRAERRDPPLLRPRRPENPPQSSRRNPMHPLTLAALSLPLMGATPPSPEPLSLPGTWVMEQAYEIRADGTRTTNYGDHPSGLMMIDPAGHYSIQIFRPGRPSFASGVKAEGKPDEFREAVL